MYALCFGDRRSRALTLDGVSDTLDGPEIVHDVEEGRNRDAKQYVLAHGVERTTVGRKRLDEPDHENHAVTSAG